MTDVISVPGAATEAQGGDDARTAVIPPASVSADSMPPADGEQPLAWAPIEPAPKKRRLGLWIGLNVISLLDDILSLIKWLAANVGCWKTE